MSDVYSESYLMTKSKKTLIEYLRKSYQQGRADERKKVLQWVLNNFCDCEGICDIELCRKHSNGECIDALLETYEEQLKEQANE